MELREDCFAQDLSKYSVLTFSLLAMIAVLQLKIVEEMGIAT